MIAAPNPALRTVLIHEVDGRMKADDVAVEAPLEITLAHESEETAICVTMRTPGDDAELALGYLFAEGVIEGIGDLARLPDETDGKRITIALKHPARVDMRRLQRNVFTSSSCGACSVPSLDAIAHAACPDLPRAVPMIAGDVIHRLPQALREAQATFRRTGGLHAAALFDRTGSLLRAREDVGRHNAMDKLIGSCVRDGMLPLHEHILLVSGRASYELIQKALVARIPILAAVGAPSSLAIDLAQAHGMTLVGFVREGRYNIYHGEERVAATT